MIADLASNPRAVASACPIKETASAAPVMTPERSIGQRQDALGVQIVVEHSVQKFMNEIKSLLRRSVTGANFRAWVCFGSGGRGSDEGMEGRYFWALHAQSITEKLIVGYSQLFAGLVETEHHVAGVAALFAYGPA